MLGKRVLVKKNLKNPILMHYTQKLQHICNNIQPESLLNDKVTYRAQTLQKFQHLPAVFTQIITLVN